jgi:hypothetical protein
VVTTARDGCHALAARPMNHAAARLTLPGGGVCDDVVSPSH